MKSQLKSHWCGALGEPQRLPVKAKQKLTSSPLAITKELNDFLAELR